MHSIYLSSVKILQPPLHQKVKTKESYNCTQLPETILLLHQNARDESICHAVPKVTSTSNETIDLFSSKMRVHNLRQSTVLEAMGADIFFMVKLTGNTQSCRSNVFNKHNLLMVYQSIMPWLKDCPQNFTAALEASLLSQLFIFGQSFSPGHYSPIYQPPKWVYSLSTLQSSQP